MKKLKEDKGITLVALIITIIVLLILAVVTISAVNEGSIFSHANNAAKTYSEKEAEENTFISGYVSKMKEYDNGNIDDTIEDINGTYHLLGENNGTIEINETTVTYVNSQNNTSTLTCEVN